MKTPTASLDDFAAPDPFFRITERGLDDREVVHWRDYLDPIAVFDALGWPPR